MTANDWISALGAVAAIAIPLTIRCLQERHWHRVEQVKKTLDLDG